jgi:hypothetical protein
MAMASFASPSEFLYSITPYLALFIILLYSLNAYLSYQKLSHIPGPRLAAWSSLWLVRAVYRKQSHLEFYAAAKKYGELCFV